MGWSGPGTDPNSHLAGPDCFSGNPYLGALEFEGTSSRTRGNFILTTAFVIGRDAPKIAGTELQAITTNLPWILVANEDYQKALFGEGPLGKPNREAEEFISEYKQREMQGQSPLSYRPVVRFKTQKELENFLGIYVQAVISDKSGIEWDLRSNEKDLIAEMGMENKTDSPTKNYCLAVVEKIIKQDIANFL